MVIGEVCKRLIPVRRSFLDTLCDAEVETHSHAGHHSVQNTLHRLRARFELTQCSRVLREGRTTTGFSCLS